MSAIRTALIIAFLLGACALGLTQSTATLQAPPGRNASTQAHSFAHHSGSFTTVADRVPATRLSAANDPQQSSENNAVSENAGQNTQAQSTQTQGENNLPSSGSTLPLLSVIGFGVLVGGIASALKTR